VLVSEGLEVQFVCISSKTQTSMTHKTPKVQSLGSARKGSKLLLVSWALDYRCWI